jgi:prepilin-type N-terminal cleavage/methylation domain-containing protein
MPTVPIFPRPRRWQSGFSLLEMMFVLLIMTTVLGVAISGLADLQKKEKNEQNKLDIVQEGREFMDQIVRDLHQAGYPGQKLYATSTFSGTTGGATYSQKVAVGLVSFSTTDLWFEGDVDGDGRVNVIRYTLYNDGNGNCPCTLKRSQSIKADSTAPLSQTSTNYNVEVQNVVNSSSPSPKPILGSTYLGGQSVTFDTLYAGLKVPSIFVAYKADGTKITESSTAITDSATLNSIKTIKVTLNLLAPYAGLDNNLRASVSLTANARVGNN